MMRLFCAKTLVTGAVLLSGLAPLAAQEHKELGRMWLFEAIPAEFFDSEYGFRPSQEWLDHARLASLRLPGCSSSFVSPRGLVMTNHHCARDYVKAVTPEGEDWLTTGHFATSLAEEIRVPDLQLEQMVSARDVTDRVNEGVTDDMDESVLQAHVAENRKKIMAEVEAEQPDLKHEIKALYQGGMYQLYSFKIYDDVRLVGNPDLKIAKFGGDPDNFTFPRFSLDFTFLRAWEDGKPADTAAHYFKVKTRGPEDGETVFVTGNPGSTGRLKTIAQMEFMRDVDYPFTLVQINQRLDMMRAQAEANPEADLRNDILRLENGQKAYTGYLDGLKNEEVMNVKRAAEQRIREAIAADPELDKRFGNAWTAIEELVAETRALLEQQQALIAKLRSGEIDQEAAQEQIKPIRDSLMAIEPRERGLEKRIGEAFFAVYGTDIPPDATFSLRISDGVVKGYEYNGTLAPYFTSLYGLYARNTEFGNVEPFALEPAWLEKIGELDLTTPFNLVCTADIIGGNSGSPLLNKELEVVGLVFDGNIESLGNRFVFTDDVPRTVCVHPAIMVAALRTIYGMNDLADEFEGKGPGYQ